jgi:hypothetical protein
LLDFVLQRVPFADGGRGLVDNCGECWSRRSRESGDPVEALPGFPLYAGMTNRKKSVEKSFRGREVIDFPAFPSRPLWRKGYTAGAL